MQDKISGSAASAASYVTSGGTTLFGAMTANQIAAYGGLTLGALTFIINWYYRHKHYQLVKASSNTDANAEDRQG